jgi:aspartyl-tRNA(Asn)/glutamyl-tRNA(Gln) amidotransferase subunit A
VEDTAFASIQQLGARYRDGSLDPVAVVEAALARIARLDAELNAFADPLAEAARAEAKQRAAELAVGHDRGPLHGIPVAIKDLIEVADAPTGFGSRVCTPVTASADAPLVARLRAAGAVILGKTNLLEYAYGIAHPEVGQTNNPYDLGRTSGGSSGGSAAAVAAGIVPIAIGTDTGGSIRIPAAYCGIVGLKPSCGLVPTEGVFPLSWTLDHAGPLARTVEDAALALAALADAPVPLAPVSLAGVRIGLVRHHFDHPAVTADVRASIEAAVAQLTARGAAVTAVTIPDLAPVNRELLHILLPEAALIHADLHAQNAGGYAPATRAQIEAGFAAKATDYVRAQRYRAALRDAVEAEFAEVDVLVSPAVPFVAPVEDPEFVEGDYDGEMLASGFANMTGHPALSLPCGFAGHLPVGLQLTGRLGDDARLLSIAAAVEAALDAYRQPALT